LIEAKALQIAGFFALWGWIEVVRTGRG
jgi:hypothetical protein